MSEEVNKYEDIVPYSDEEAVEALRKVSMHPVVPVISKFIFPTDSPFMLSQILRSIGSIDEFQHMVMFKAVARVIESTVKNFTYDGLENYKGQSLLMSNHRDIILDPAFTQYILAMNDLPLTEICVGDNLLSHKTLEYLLRSNRMIKVIRGISARELYLSSQYLSAYIRESITANNHSVWIAQRQGRTKDGIDTTEQGLLKMLDMSGKESFAENFEALNITPISISYEYEPCDLRKAREMLIKRTSKYVKKPNEDLHSILTGISQRKGNVHLQFDAPLTREEIEEAALCDKNDRYQAIRHTVDRRIIKGYKLWKSNFIAYDMVNNTSKYADRYDAADVESFQDYIRHRLRKAERSLDREELKDIFLKIYSNPVSEKEARGFEV